MTVYFGEIDTYFVNVLSQVPFGGRRMMSINGSFGTGILWFYPEDTSLPNNRKRPDQDVFDVYYRLDAWDAVLDVLRYESPVHFNYSDSNNSAQIYTGQEPVGDGEFD